MTPRNCREWRGSGRWLCFWNEPVVVLSNNGEHLLRETDCKRGRDSPPFAAFTLLGRDLAAPSIQGLEPVSRCLALWPASELSLSKRARATKKARAGCMEGEEPRDTECSQPRWNQQQSPARTSKASHGWPAGCPQSEACRDQKNLLVF